MSLARYRRPLLAAVLLAAGVANASATLLSESFDDVGTLAADGWLLVNLGVDPAIPNAWFQGQPDQFAARSGDAGAYVASNYNAGAPGTALDNWLVTPAFSTASAVTVTFWMRGLADPGFLDQVRFGFGDADGTIASVATGSLITATDAWTEYSVTLAAAGAGSTARFAIDYTGAADLADYLGIDDLAVTAAPAAAVPEPASWLMLGAGALGLAAARRRRLKAGAAGVLLAATFAAAATDAPPDPGNGPAPANQVAVRDAATGRLRAPSAEESASLRGVSPEALRQAPVRGTLLRQHRSGAGGVRLSDAFMSYAVTVRQPDGRLAEFCFSSRAAAEAAIAGPSPASDTPPLE